MNKYVGTKLVMAMAMSFGGFYDKMEWSLQEGDNPNAEGYLVEYINGGEPNHPDHTGYISWSPKDVFESSYRPVSDGLTFSAALETAKLGTLVKRRDWAGYCVTCQPSGLVMGGHNGKAETFSPWMPSMVDIMTDDWEIAE